MLKENQKMAIQKTIDNEFASGVHFQATGCGKCQIRGTPIIMHDGRIRTIERIRKDDYVMGDDSLPRRVLTTTRGIGRMYTVHQDNGDSYSVNYEHILCLMRGADIVEMRVGDYLSLSETEKKGLRGYKTAIEFWNKKKMHHAFLVGFLCGHYRRSIPSDYKYSKKDDRLGVLKGIFRARGAITGPWARFRNCGRRLNADLLYLARSLGFKSYRRDHQILINLIKICPTTPIRIEYIGIKEYFGFSLEGNGRYLLGDFTVTHNSWIGLQILCEFHTKYPKENVMWICEYKNVLQQQFTRQRLQAIGFSEVRKRYHILELYEKRPTNWIQSIYSSRFWDRPVLIIMNRAFLTSRHHYKQIRVPIALIIHDESHTIHNVSTQQFYHFMLQKHPDLRCIGFSATPCLEHRPFQRIISSYSIYDAFLDRIIVPPKIVWIKPMNTPLNPWELALTIRQLIRKLPYQKIIVWCGLIGLCRTLAQQWAPIFRGFYIGIDTSLDKGNDNGFATFRTMKKRAILFCACKHREGSDIENLDGCVFMDGVTNRNSKTFVQCIGRVLRIDPGRHKQHGLIIDIEAKSPIKIFKRMQEYLILADDNQETGHGYPWHFESAIFKFPSTKRIKVHFLTMQRRKTMPSHDILPLTSGIQDLKDKFVRPIPDEAVYAHRIQKELALIESKRLIPYLLQAVKILDITRGIPHITRGSCGSSLVCFLLGISHFDPVRYGIRFARFLNEFRDTLPDIDFDFPYDLRDEVFLKLELLWPGKIARISNHNFYHTRSALRKAVRNAGVRHFIPKHGLLREIQGFDKSTQEMIRQESLQLENTFRGYSLHCGGIVFFPEGIPDHLVVEGKRYHFMKQIRSDKRDIAREKRFKIDILSSRALSQLSDGLEFAPIDFEMVGEDRQVFQSLMRGDNIGITFAESPLMRRALLKMKPTCLYDIAVCLAIIRPAARDAYRCHPSPVDAFIFDDDAIDMIVRIVGCDEGAADRIRRIYAKSVKEGVEELKKYDLTSNNLGTLCHQLKNLRRYSFCKSHALSYAQLIYQLAALKLHHPQKFWEATLKHCQSSYRKWVHYYEARLHNVIARPQSIYAKNRRETMSRYPLDEQMRRFGFWEMRTKDFYPDCYFSRGRVCRFRGLIASQRIIVKKEYKTILIFLGVAPREYIELEWDDHRIVSLSAAIGVEGVGRIMEDDLPRICVSEYCFF